MPFLLPFQILRLKFAKYPKHKDDNSPHLAELSNDLGFALSHVTHLFHPEVIVMGGGLSLVGEPLRAAVAEVLPRLVMEVFHGGPKVKLALLGEDAVPVGALLLARSAA